MDEHLQETQTKLDLVLEFLNTIDKYPSSPSVLGTYKNQMHRP